MKRPACLLVLLGAMALVALRPAGAQTDASPPSAAASTVALSCPAPGQGNGKPRGTTIRWPRAGGDTLQITLSCPEPASAPASQVKTPPAGGCVTCTPSPSAGCTVCVVDHTPAASAYRPTDKQPDESTGKPADAASGTKSPSAGGSPGTALEWFTGLTMLTLAVAIVLLLWWPLRATLSDGFYFRSHWGGFGGSSTGWEVSAPLVVLLLVALLAIAGATLGGLMLLYAPAHAGNGSAVQSVPATDPAKSKT